MDKIPYFTEGEVWSCYLGKNIGFEQNGSGDQYLRPVVVMKKYNKHLFFGIPLTTKYKDLSFYFPIGTVQEKEAYAILIQCNSLSTIRLKRRISILNVNILEKLKSAAKAYCFGS
ncbi:MAG: hypothetical protein JWL88_778 [Parcubacteria group bacterium]|nr:hypothetical protein [Parcubacteria group bacterium]